MGVASICATVTTRTVTCQTTVRGVAVDSTDSPVALVSVESGGRRVITGSNGVFQIPVSLPDSILRLRRVGFRPADLSLADVFEGGVIDLGRVTLVAVPIRLDDIAIEALDPILSPRAIRAFNFARREGVPHHFFTAYEIERLRPSEIGELARRVPGARTVEDARWGRAIQLQGADGWCPATVVLDGMRTTNPNPDALIAPERVGAMWFSPRACLVTIWTKPEIIEAASPFELGVRVANSRYDGSLQPGFWGAYLLLPVVEDRVSLYPAVDFGLDLEEGRWHLQLAARVRLLGRRPMTYAGLGVRYHKYDSSESSNSDVFPVVLIGLSLPWRFLHPFVEVEVAAPTQTQDRRMAVVTGIAYRR